jgi:hypothetical protein
VFRSKSLILCLVGFITKNVRGSTILALLLLVSSKNVLFFLLCVCVFISWSTSNMDSCILLCTRACSYTPLYTPDCDRLHLLRHRSCFYACDTPCVNEKKELETTSVLKKMRVRNIFNLRWKQKKKMKSSLRLPVIFLDFFISRGFKDVGPFVVFFVVAFAF